MVRLNKKIRWKRNEKETRARMMRIDRLWGKIWVALTFSVYNLIFSFPLQRTGMLLVFQVSSFFFFFIFSARARAHPCVACDRPWLRKHFFHSFSICLFLFSISYSFLFFPSSLYFLFSNTWIFLSTRLFFSKSYFLKEHFQI